MKLNPIILSQLVFLRCSRPCLAAPPPSATIPYGTVIGGTANGADYFLGVPFAQPPIGNLRLRPPQPVTSSFGTIPDTTIPAACPQFNAQTTPTAQEQPAKSTRQSGSESENCLTVNVQRPAGTTSTSKLPVLFWIYGGGFESDSTSGYDGEYIIQKSVALAKPIIFVAVNYRLGGFGFLAGSELSSQKSTNLGLRDQRLGLQWVQQNIAAFGGDPSSWGESAGSISVFDQLLINGGNNTFNGKPLFRSAIPDSGSYLSANTVTTRKAQNVYNTVVANAGCSGAADTTACLRSVDYQTFLNAANSVPNLSGYRSVDLSYLPRPDPSDEFFPQNPPVAIAASNYTKVPIIIGDDEDEGTLFARVQSNITDNADLVAYITSWYPQTANAQSLVEHLVSYYPDQPSLGQPAGSPFRTGGNNNQYPEFTRLAAVLGDVIFTLARRVALYSMTGQRTTAWSYLNSFACNTSNLGKSHGAELGVICGNSKQYPLVTNTTQAYYINFVYNLNPNGPPNSQLPNWRTWTPNSMNLLQFILRCEIGTWLQVRRR